MNDQNAETTVTLIYYNFRGLAQSIRAVLYYLNIPFKQILLNPGQQPSTLQILKPHQISGDLEFPCLVDGKHLIPTCFAIKRYLCTKANRQDLLGSTLEERTLIREIYYNFLLKKKKIMNLLFKFGEKAMNNPTKKQEIRKQAMLYSHKESGSLVPTVTLKLRNPHQRYIFSHITVLDFLFYETSFYQINLFGNLEEKKCKILETINSIFGTDLRCGKDKETILLRVMREFKESFQKEPFYINNKEKLQSYSVISPSMGKLARQSFKSVWLGPQHFTKETDAS